MKIIICDECRKVISWIHPQVLDGCSVTKHSCSPGYGSRYDGSPIVIDFPDGDYCYECLDGRLDCLSVRT